MTQKHVAIVTVANDLHALAVRESLRQHSDVTCHIIEADRLCGSAGLNWSSFNVDQAPTTVPADDCTIEVGRLDVIWWRRVNSPQVVPEDVTNPSHIDLINNDCRATLFGILFNEFAGTWISHPSATTFGENKLTQLNAARQAGFQVPRTLVSQDPVNIRRFCAGLRNGVVVKPVRGTRQAPVLTTMLQDEHLTSDTSLRLCPTMYQEYIPGKQHIRVCCFGNDIYATQIESEELDWRKNLDIPLRKCELSEELQIRLQNVLQLLGLRMGIFDLKVSNDGVVWLEVNPQGQFLFLEALTGIALTSAFADYLYREAQEAGTRRFETQPC